jgi:hypothetical protein
MVQLSCRDYARTSSPWHGMGMTCARRTQPVATQTPIPPWRDDDASSVGHPRSSHHGLTNTLTYRVRISSTARRNKRSKARCRHLEYASVSVLHAHHALDPLRLRRARGERARLAASPHQKRDLGRRHAPLGRSQREQGRPAQCVRPRAPPQTQYSIWPAVLFAHGLGCTAGVYDGLFARHDLQDAAYIVESGAPPPGTCLTRPPGPFRRARPRPQRQAHGCGIIRECTICAGRRRTGARVRAGGAVLRGVEPRRRDRR